MAAIMIESPGKGTGPCLKCDHTDCAENRERVKDLCAICSKPVGYDTKFFCDEAGTGEGWRTTHMLCRVKEIEDGKRKVAQVQANAVAKKIRREIGMS
jgi:hypothetical protein